MFFPQLQQSAVYRQLDLVVARRSRSLLDRAVHHRTTRSRVARATPARRSEVAEAAGRRVAPRPAERILRSRRVLLQARLRRAGPIPSFFWVQMRGHHCASGT